MQQNNGATLPSESEMKTSPLVWMTMRDLFMAIIIGMATGLATIGISMLMNRFVFAAVLCRTDTSGDCSNAPLYSAIVAMVIGAILALIVLARVRTFRPLLVVIAASVSLWGMYIFTEPLVWYLELIIAAVLYGLAFGIFSWVARIRSFILSVVVSLVVIVAIRLMLTA